MSRLSPAASVALGAVLMAVALPAAAIKILREYERGVVFFLDLRTRVFDVPAQDVISRDSVSVKANAVIYFRVVDPQRQLAQTTLRALLGTHELDQMLAEREKPNLDTWI